MTTRTISYERLYKIGDFSNVKFGDLIIDIPEEHVFNKEVINKVRYLQMTEIELMYQKYSQLREVTNALPTSDEVIAMLNDMRNKTLTELNEILNKEK